MTTNNFFIVNNFNLIKEDFPITQNCNAIIYIKSEHENIAKVQTELLNNMIIKGLKMELNQFLFVDISLYKKFSINQLSKKYKQINVVIMGINSLDLQMNIKTNLYQNISLGNQKIIFSHSPENIAADATKKKLIFTCLLKMFEI